MVFLLLMITTNWLVARYCDTIDMGYEVDIFTVYFFVWQFIYLIYKWLYQDLPMLSFSLHQKATCLYMALTAFMEYDVLFRLLPTYMFFAVVWLWSAIDV